ncbi:hypothetical protein NTGZN8_180082 [Candidatus Nitrotoga fabula]|uniref:Uncharacterized protein n=1 Tax=Candidatus Nitrotoga fabula TaxID=2182327 RepID=A0A916BBT9_9PROT|nr:hypothetical protein NTGZN8_180082 [Candidatus Nitrotoga fabula]
MNLRYSVNLFLDQLDEKNEYKSLFRFIVSVFSSGGLHHNARICPPLFAYRYNFPAVHA